MHSLRCHYVQTVPTAAVGTVNNKDDCCATVHVRRHGCPAQVIHVSCQASEHWWRFQQTR